MKDRKTYRVFVTRHYIDVCFFDVEADTPAKARNAAKKAAYKLREDSRNVACDNGWLADSPVVIDHLGSSAAPFTPTLFHEQGTTKVYHDNTTNRTYSVGRVDGKGPVQHFNRLEQAEFALKEIASADEQGVINGDYYIDGPDR